MVAMLMGVAVSFCGADDVLPRTERLTIERPLDEIMVVGLRRFCLRELARSPAKRSERWRPYLASSQRLETHVIERRERLRELLGATDERLTSDRNRATDFELLATLSSTLSSTSVLARNELVTVHRARWPVLTGVTAEGLLLVPRKLRAAVVALPDADWTPEMFCGVDKNVPGPEMARFVRRLAESGCLVVVPTLIGRSDELSGHKAATFTNQPHREFVYRQAFEVGRHVIGYEVQKVLAAVDLLERRRGTMKADDDLLPLGVFGVGEGGLIALHSAALDPRIDVCCVSGYFECRETVWQEPIYRNVWGILTEFGDAELAGMIAPRQLVIEAARAVEVAGPPAARLGRSSVAAPGRIATCELNSVRSEFERASTFYRTYDQSDRLSLVVSGRQGDGEAGSDSALLAFALGLRVADQLAPIETAWSRDESITADPLDAARTVLDRETRQFEELQAHVQTLLHRSHQVRDARWRLNPAAIQEWQRKQPQLRKWVHEELIGKVSDARLPLRPRSRRVIETEQCVGYEVVIDVCEDVIAGGILLIPRGLKPGEKRPVVVCQHGLEGTPLDTISQEPRAHAIYKAFSVELVKQGFVVYAPQNPYRGGDRFRELQRMSNPLQRTLFSYIVEQHEQTLDWLATLPFVDPDRIAFYGISYGGKAAMRVPPLVERYRLAICSGDFTDWPRTLAANDERFSYLFTSEYEVFEWNLAHVASYAELAMLMSPRPFMVEEGHRDGGQPSEWVAGEFGKVRRHYDQLGIGDRAVLEFFDGPHTIHGTETYRFLRRFP